MTERGDPPSMRRVNTEEVAVARKIIHDAKAVTVLTGAGISTDSGIPDFRGPNGLWTTNPEAERASNIRFYVSDPELRRNNWALRANGDLWADVEPNDGHWALVALERQDKLHTLITQNVDELHQRAGTSAQRIVEIHGTTRQAGCLDCTYRVPMSEVLGRVRAGEPDPACPNCGGILKSATISFGQSLIADDLQRAHEAAKACDVFLAVGTSLTVFPINESARIAHRHGARLVIVNAEPTPFDDLAEVVVRGNISDTLPELVRPLP